MSNTIPTTPLLATGQSASPASLIHTRDGILLPHPGESLLETLERHGHRLEFQCRSGYCGACRTPLLAGKVHYPHVPLAFISQGECLPCCCQPQGAIRLDLQKAEASRVG